jgi:hypothetical protein
VRRQPLASMSSRPNSSYWSVADGDEHAVHGEFLDGTGLEAFQIIPDTTP